MGRYAAVYEYQREHLWIPILLFGVPTLLLWVTGMYWAVFELLDNEEEEER